MQVIAVLLLVLCHLAISHAWTCNEVPRLYDPQQVDAGLGQVVATDKHHNGYYLSGISWYNLPSAELKHVSVGPAGTWGIDKSDHVLKLVGGEWKTLPGASLKQVDAGGNGFIVGANRYDNPWCLRSGYTMGYRGVGRPAWNRMPGWLQYYSCGPYGCWSVNRPNKVYVMKSVTPASCAHSRWMEVRGVPLTMIEVGTDGSVFGLTPKGEVYQRRGVDSKHQQGTSWTRIPMCMPMKHVSYDLGRLWVVSKSGFLMQCTQ